MFLSTILLICWDCLWGILPWLLGAWLLGWLFWWLFNHQKYKAHLAALEGDINALKSKNTSLESELDQAYYVTKKLESEHSTIRSKYDNLLLNLKACEEEKESLEDKFKNSIASPVPESIDPIPTPIEETPSDEDQTDNDSLGIIADTTTDDSQQKTSTGYADYLKEDNLQIIEGVGPKIEGLLKAEGINTWTNLANTDEDNLKAILEKAGPRYRIHDPKTWQKQAQLAANGQWDELIKHQKFVGGGKDVNNISNSQSKVEKLYLKARGLKAYALDDLKAIEGIGLKIEGLLKAAGIDTWAKLSKTKKSKLQEILNNAGDRFRLADPTTWPKQAKLAAKGKWDDLQDYQDSLKGGRK